MAVKTYLQKAESATLETKKIEILAEREYRITYTQSGTKRVDYFDFSNYNDNGQPLYGLLDIGYNNVIQQFETYPSVVFNIFGNAEATLTPEAEIDAYPHYLFLASGETQTAETTIRTYTYSPSDARKLALFKHAYAEIWEPQVEQWLKDAVGFIGLSFDILKRGGQVLKAASYALHQMALDTDIDKADLATITRLMAQGATDVTNPLEFAKYLNGLGQYFPNGPVKPRTSGVPTPGATHTPVGVLWVAQNASGNYERVASTAVVFKDDYEVPADYNPNDLEWLDSL